MYVMRIGTATPLFDARAPTARAKRRPIGFRSPHCRRIPALDKPLWFNHTAPASRVAAFVTSGGSAETGKKKKGGVGVGGRVDCCRELLPL